MRHLSKIGILMFVASVATSALAAGCASMPLRTETSTSGISTAEEAGADQIPRASLHLQLAREELQRAKKLQANGDSEKASSMLMRSEADSELAVAISHGAAQKIETEKAIEKVHQQQDNRQP